MNPRLLQAAMLFLSLSGVAYAQVSAEDEVTPQVQALYAQAKAAQQRGDDAAAVEKYRAMLKLAPHLAPAYNNLGMLYFNQHDYPHAAEVLKRGLEINPDMSTASALLGMSYREMGDHEQAEPLLETAVRTNPTDDNLQMSLARNLIDLGKYDAATPYLRSYLARNPKDQQAWYLLGKTYLQLSEDALGQINQIDPNSVTAHLVSGEIDESMHNYDGALVEYKKAIELAPQQPGTHEHMGNTFWVTGKWESAAVEFKSELANSPNNCAARWKLANATLEANGSPEEALSDVNQAIERCPKLMQARVDRARALIKLGRQKEALPDLLLAEKDSPKEPSIHFLLSQVYKAGGQTTEAHQELRTYADLQREASQAVAGQASDAISIKSTSH
jgi:tetratricopeptide (TPR) repeat protein